ncbi:MAG: UDP-glucose 4-epimerase GalE [Planctomycetota bacterium]|nr:UDP-glucose 4-epimerase GalE [Planctomycetota bacterium]
MSQVVLVTGGAGYIGSHTTLELLQAGWDVVVVDNLCNSSSESLTRVARLAGREPVFVEADVRDVDALHDVFRTHAIDAVIHFAALKAVGESAEQPLRYYDNNVTGTCALLDVMGQHDVRRLVFSSSATVYGDPESVPVQETAPLSATNPYGRSKLMMEDIMRDLAAAEPAWHILLLRYFNPVGAHPSGEIGEDPRGIPNNLMPYLMQVAAGRHPHLRIFGDDYETPDGTGVRDYIHVVDLALGHVAALDRLPGLEGCTALNLGTGRGYSVMEMLRAAEAAVGREIPHEIVARRPGDSACSYADPALAETQLGWRAARDLDAMVADHWRWQERNPQGFAGA